MPNRGRLLLPVLQTQPLLAVRRAGRARRRPVPDPRSMVSQRPTLPPAARSQKAQPTRLRARPLPQPVLPTRTRAPSPIRSITLSLTVKRKLPLLSSLANLLRDPLPARLLPFKVKQEGTLVPNDARIERGEERVPTKELPSPLHLRTCQGETSSLPRPNQRSPSSNARNSPPLALRFPVDRWLGSRRLRR